MGDDPRDLYACVSFIQSSSGCVTRRIKFWPGDQFQRLCRLTFNKVVDVVLATRELDEFGTYDCEASFGTSLNKEESSSFATCLRGVIYAPQSRSTLVKKNPAFMQIILGWPGISRMDGLPLRDEEGMSFGNKRINS